ncbi:carbohydrate ABC transporter permease [Diaminobutyricibacter sp. McL0608]|uniref:carbohydrate ABC transporter permease n=1 Tax=Leifsonia sp. McL0608 TaxID=3143537 RepID=UPI0031F2EF29
MRRHETAWGLAFVTPIALQVILFCIVPVGIAIYAGFTNWNGLSGRQDFIGLENFATFLTDKYFWIASGNTLVMLVPIPFYLFFGILLAVGVHRGTPGSGVFRILFFLPYISSIVALVVLWKWIFNYQYGLVNQGLALIGIQGPDWLGDPAWIKTTIVLMIAWKLIGITSIYVLAGLNNISETYYEAARIDGASAARQFFQITLPMLTPAIFFLTIIGVIGSLQTFVEVQLFTADGGRDYSAATITYYIWQKAFGSNELGLASATAVFFALVILGVTLIQFRLSRRWVFEGE